MKTADLMRQNQQLSRELEQLKKDTHAFVQSVLSNPENASLVSASRVSSNMKPIYVSSNLEFHVFNEAGQLKPLPTVLTVSSSSSCPSVPPTTASVSKTKANNANKRKLDFAHCSLFMRDQNHPVTSKQARLSDET